MKHAEIIEMSVSNYKHIMSGNSFYRTDKTLVRALGWEFAGFLTDLIERDSFFSNNPHYDGWFYCEKWKRSIASAFNTKKLQRLMKLATDGNFVQTEMRVTGDNRKQWIKINYNQIYTITYDFLMIIKSEECEYSRDKLSTQSRQNVHTVETNCLHVQDKLSTPYRQNRPDINKTINNKNTDKTKNKTIKQDSQNLCGLNQNEPISSVPPLGNSSVQKPKVSGRPARKPIQEIVAPDPHLIIVTDLERISKKFCPNNKITPSQSKAWLSEIKKLFRKWSGSVDDLHQMLRTYYNNYDPDNQYHVVIRSASALHNKINQLERFCKTLQTDSKPTVKKYQENFKSDTKGKYDNIKETVINVDED